MSARYAVYYAPPAGSPLWRFGSAAIGYDSATGADLPPPPGLPPDGVSAEAWSNWTADPRRYGFHATLKAPFGLCEDATEAELREVAARFAKATAPVRLPPLGVRAVGAFVALVPEGPAPELMALADSCVAAFDPVRAPLAEADRARRLSAPLTARQIAQLDRWGYPYVGEDFRFHMTLTGALPDEARDRARDALARLAIATPPEAAIGEIALFRQADREARFRVLASIPLTG